MKIKKDIDVSGDTAPSAQSGTLPWDNPGIQVPSSIPMTEGETAVGKVTEHKTSKSQPIKKGGSGYTG